MRISIFGYLRASPAPVASSLVYRLRHWPDELPGALHTVDVLRALSVMSNRPVNREWIARTAKLKPNVLDELLDLLVARGEIDVVDTSKFGLPE